MLHNVRLASTTLRCFKAVIFLETRRWRNSCKFSQLFCSSHKFILSQKTTQLFLVGNDFVNGFDYSVSYLYCITTI